MQYKAAMMQAAFLFFILTPTAMPQSLKELQAQIKSMEACQQSLRHSDCNLNILDKGLRDTLIQLDKLNQSRQSAEGRRSPAPTASTAGGRAQYFTGSIMEASGEILKFLGGSVWRLDRTYFGLAFQDAIVVMTDQQNATIYANDNSYNARLLSGSVSTSMGVIRTVVEKMGDGAILKLDDGTLLEFSSYERYDTGWWLPRIMS